MRNSIFYLSSLIIFASSVSSSLYPTQPIAHSVFTGGKYNNVTWIDNDSVPGPPLNQLGKLQIDLWAGDIKRVATLARGVDPLRMFQEVFIPQRSWHNATNFVIRFKSYDPKETIYTAEFSITNMTGSQTTQFDEKLGQSYHTEPEYSSTSNFSSTSIIRDGGNNDMVTVTMEMPDSNTPETSSTSAETVAALAKNSANGGRHVRRPSMQFNFVFVFFPAIFGLALAL